MSSPTPTGAAAAAAAPPAAASQAGARPGEPSGEAYDHAAAAPATIPELLASAPPLAAALAAQQKEGVALSAAQQQAVQEQVQAAMASGGQDLGGPALAQLQQMLALQQQMAAQHKFRPVPDHQEVFADANQDQSLVIEILEIAKVENNRCAHYFFEDLAVQNDAESSTMETVYTLNAAEVPNLPPHSVCACALGYQTIAKGRQPQDTSNYVQIILGVVRLPQVQSDIVISLNTPAYIHEKSASAEHAGAGAKTAYLRAPDLFKQMLQSFKILDMGLFGSS
eukprot:jgi/Tetstr1/422593/TSEL_013400.t1